MVCSLESPGGFDLADVLVGDDVAGFVGEGLVVVVGAVELGAVAAGVEGVVAAFSAGAVPLKAAAGAGAGDEPVELGDDPGAGGGVEDLRQRRLGCVRVAG